MFVVSYLEYSGGGLKLDRKMVPSHTSVFPRIAILHQLACIMIGFGSIILFLMEQIFPETVFEYFIAISRTIE